MIYSLSLREAGWILGLLLVVTHLLALLHAKGARQLVLKFPRSHWAGVLLLSVAAIWSYQLVSTIDLGEFTPWRGRLQLFVVAGYFLTMFLVTDYLAVRALGMICLLAAEPLLEAAFLRPELSRLLVTVVAYVWVVFGLFWVGKPHLLRNKIEWVTADPSRWNLAAFGGLAYGLAVLFCTLFLYA